MENKMFSLDDRRILHVTGADAFDFLQNVITNDMAQVMENGIIYACLLTPQGQWLHDFFIRSDGQDGFICDVERDGFDDLMRRLTMFKLRAKVVLKADDSLHAYAALHDNSQHGVHYQDPRIPALGYRLYAQDKIENALPVFAYDDMCISLGVPCAGKTIARGRDVMADVNLDVLNAASWTKGCFIGQEVAARMHHRNLMKRRLAHVAGEKLEIGALLDNGQAEIGQIRHVSSDGKSGLAVAKLGFMADTSHNVTLKNGVTVTLHPPAYMAT